MKYQQNKYNLLVLLFICYVSYSNAQLLSAKNTETDTELWTGIDFAKELTKKVDLSFAYQIRLRENISIIRANFGQIGLTFPVLKESKKLKATTSLRANRNENANWTVRPMLDIAYGLFKNDFIGINYRVRFQKEFETNTSESFNNLNFFDELYWRNRIMLEYKNFDDFEPYFGIALFKNVESQSITIDQFRLITGFNYKVNKRQSLKVSYIYREKFNIKNQGVNHIISIKFNFEIKDFKKKKKNKKEVINSKENSNQNEKKETKKQSRSKLLGPHRIEP